VLLHVMYLCICRARSFFSLDPELMLWQSEKVTK
jgi:hypothetical protein